MTGWHDAVGTRVLLPLADRCALNNARLQQHVRRRRYGALGMSRFDIFEPMLPFMIRVRFSTRVAR